MKAMFISLIILATAALLSADYENGLRDYLLGQEIVKQRGFYLSEDLTWSMAGEVISIRQPLRRLFAWGVGSRQALNVAALFLFLYLGKLLRLRWLGSASGLLILTSLLFFESRALDQSFGAIFLLVLLIQIIKGRHLAELCCTSFLGSGFSSALTGAPIILLAFLLTAPRGDTFGLLWQRFLAVCVGVAAGLLLFGRDEFRSIDTHQLKVMLPALGTALVLAALSRRSVNRPWSALLVVSLLLTLVDSVNLPLLIVSIPIWVSLLTDRIYHSRPIPALFPLIWLVPAGLVLFVSAPERAPVFKVKASRVFNPPQIGAVLQVSGVKTFIDERREIFSEHSSSVRGREAFSTYQRVYNLQEDWRKRIQEFNVLVIPDNHPLNEVLPDWNRVGEAGELCRDTPRGELCERYLELQRP